VVFQEESTANQFVPWTAFDPALAATVTGKLH
jgi:hypothetical protein